MVLSLAGWPSFVAVAGGLFLRGDNNKWGGGHGSTSNNKNRRHTEKMSMKCEETRGDQKDKEKRERVM